MPEVENRGKEDEAIDPEIRNQRVCSPHGCGTVSPEEYFQVTLY